MNRLNLATMCPEVINEIEQGILITINNMLNKNLSWKRKRKFKIEFTFSWLSSDTLNASVLFAGKGDLPPCNSVPFYLRIGRDDSGAILINVTTKQRAEEDEEVDPMQENLFAETSGVAGETTEGDE